MVYITVAALGLFLLTGVLLSRYESRKYKRDRQLMRQRARGCKRRKG